eukprot:CAMPEP_0184502298 /NCGR_PEP_ID=MMETSP0113_2-20130426/49919_1 /TAXON_ID=91329 /ORGANISM="Norrisiella sphaerica, Strain BC52" /LENGTH=492 /DNA_ID=CAMNT_0026891389 /DNA_START=192 /DNA_END=1666 /DNA_ORIENTATION=-
MHPLNVPVALALIASAQCSGTASINVQRLRSLSLLPLIPVTEDTSCNPGRICHARVNTGGVRAKRAVFGALQSRLAVMAARGPAPVDTAGNDKELFHSQWRRLPLQPGEFKKTVMEQVVPGSVYTFEQQLGVFDVVVNIRMTALVLKEGLMLVNPIAPTPECVGLVQAIERKHGPIKYLLLPTTQVEHKVNLAPFVDAFPHAEVWSVRRQWSFPPIPLSWIQFFPNKIDGYLEPEITQYAPFSAEVEVKLLDISLPGTIPTPFQEAALYHKPSRSLLVTDAVISVPRSPPKIIENSPQSLLKIAGVWNDPDKAEKDEKEKKYQGQRQIPMQSAAAALNKVNTKQNRNLGWAKTVLLALFLSPASVSKDLKRFAQSGFVFEEGWENSFEALLKKVLVVSPLVSELVFKPQGAKVLEWAEDVATWSFQRVIPAHFAVARRAGPKNFLEAFEFLRKNGGEVSAGAKSNFAAGAMPTIPGTLKEDYDVLSTIARIA